MKLINTEPLSDGSEYPIVSSPKRSDDSESPMAYSPKVKPFDQLDEDKSEDTTTNNDALTGTSLSFYC